MKALITSLLFLLLFIFLLLQNFSLLAKGNVKMKIGPQIINKSHTLGEDLEATFTMEVTEIKNGKTSKNSPMKMTYFLREGQVAIRPEMEEKQKTLMIYDIEDRMMTTLIDQNGEKTGMKMKMPNMKIDSEDMGDFDFNVTPTNETKTIQGFNCKKYLIESSDHTGHAWVTEEVEIDFEKLFTFMNVQKKSKSKMPKFGDLNGFALETYTKSKKKDEAYEMKITNLKVGKVDEDIFDTSGYAITDMSNLMQMGGEK